MSDPFDSDAPCPMALSQASHEIRTQLTVINGYVRMVLKETAGAITDKQRRFLTDAMNAAARIYDLTVEMSELAKYDTEEKPVFERTPLDVGALVKEVVAELRPLPDREVNVEVDNQANGVIIQGDRQRLRKAVAAVISALRRELVVSSRLVVRVRRATEDGRPVVRLAIAGDHRIDELDALGPSELIAFIEKRGGCGLAPAIARRVVVEHGGRIWSTPKPPPEREDADDEVILKDSRKAEAVLELPEGA